MTKEEIILVQQSWSSLMNHLNEIGEKFYNNLFEAEPKFAHLFNVDPPQQGEKLMNLIGLAVTKLHLEKPDSAIHNVGRRHVAYGVKPEYFKKFGEILIGTFKEALKDEWDPELEAAWEKAYNKLAGFMVQAF